MVTNFSVSFVTDMIWLRNTSSITDIAFLEMMYLKMDPANRCNNVSIYNSGKKQGKRKVACKLGRT